MPDPCVHLGCPKAASTTLQHHLFDSHPQIFFLGKNSPKRGRFTSANSELLARQLHTPLEDSRLAEIQRNYREETDAVRCTGQAPLLSEENLGKGGVDAQARLANNLQAVLGPYRLLIVLRRPLDIVESLYYWRLRAYAMGSDTPPDKRLQGYFPIESWLECEWNEEARGDLWWLNVADVLEAHADIIGRENIGVFLFEKLVESPDDFISEICTFIGIDPAQGIEATAREQRNARMTEAHVRRLRKLSGSPWGKLLLRFGSRRTKRLALGLHQRHHFWHAPKSRMEIPASWRSVLLTACAGQYSRVADSWAPDILSYGYPS